MDNYNRDGISITSRSKTVDANGRMNLGTIQNIRPNLTGGKIPGLVISTPDGSVLRPGSPNIGGLPMPAAPASTPYSQSAPQKPKT